MIGGLRLSNKGKRTSDYTCGYSVEHRKQGCSNAYTYKYIHKRLRWNIKITEITDFNKQIPYYIILKQFLKYYFSTMDERI